MRKRIEEAKKKGPAKPKQPPTLRIESDTVDTGETRTIFGHTARHLITTEKEIPLAGSQQEAQERTIDGWYLDIPEPPTGCFPDYMVRGRHMVVATVLAAGHEAKDIRIETHHTGPVAEGLAAKLTVTTRTELSGKERTSVYEREVVEFSEEPLDPALFELPPGFKKVSRLYEHRQ